MKQFSDLLDTNSKLKLTIHLTPITTGGAPDILVAINQHILFDNNLEHKVILSSDIELLSPFDISIVLRNKKYQENKETAVIIESIQVDDFNIVPTYSNQATYINDHDYTDPTNYLGFNGKWTLTIDQPFYRWLHHAQNQGWLLD